MSPLPSPTPLRRSILRVLFSPAGLLLGFMVLLISTCPGARGDDALSLLAANGGFRTVDGVDLTSVDATVIPVRPVSVVARSTRFDRAPASSARSSTPAERARVAPVATSETFANSRSALPLITDPLLTDAAASAGIRPMTGPAVGIRSKLPASTR